ncbi:hypothetical protein GUITHDRAFT_117597 [Guillardia theta CCMP2712]|uniref:Uncharacterized protein n=1 Tax=Guillardia theta (strain CCMP2712) TaxID=905079 RepID=L1IJZ1_GUITC|nr:hypothetical protein GUITHDRAFT_117597 [Guillardia theta CCMP2712]EKX36239.1 hypothetical protein GUITHDRAFT_117597 [Guillardia theta CCMP2712]|eukprot:XP_005823219.1 hypothetical protein GUITHDRAFT_117597 [Guillardia theta CCMP2712]
MSTASLRAPTLKSPGQQTRRRSVRSISFYPQNERSQGKMTEEEIIPERILEGLALEVHQCPILQQEWVEQIFKHNPAASPEGSYMIWRPTASSRLASGVLDHHRGFTLIAISYVRLGDFLCVANDATMMIHSWHNLKVEHKLVWAVGGEGGFTCFPHRMWAPYRGAIITNFNPWNFVPIDLAMSRELYTNLEAFVRACPELRHRLDPHRFDGCPPRGSEDSLRLEHVRPHAVKQRRDDDPNVLAERLELIKLRRKQDKAIDDLNALQQQRSQLRAQGERLTDEAEDLLDDIAKLEARLDCVVYDYNESEKIETIQLKLQEGCQIPDQRYRSCVLRAQELKDRLVQLSIAHEKFS